MSRRWLQSATVEIDDATGALLVSGVGGGGGGGGGSQPPPSSLVGGTKTVTLAATPEPLVASATPCRSVWIGAPCDSNGAPTNTKPVFLGDASNQNMPLAPASITGVAIAIDDAAKIYVRVGANSEAVEYRIFV